jgi:alanyl-tRNA synthetase
MSQRLLTQVTMIQTCVRFIECPMEVEATSIEELAKVGAHQARFLMKCNFSADFLNILMSCKI